ncbi:MAG: hypothetical protein IPK17_16910 [Chloroflexi bacterium]|uniref:hypothetical protein n=1 Tax=Candidatus Flexifilum breve TaxID=3140694 RepID=UPI003135B35C|nr:hypothetical protein [Chloroflexota bacterium]
MQQAVLNAYERLVEEFIKYCEAIHEVRITSDEADNIFQEYLRENALILRSHNGGTVIPSTQERVDKSRRYFMGAFIQHLETTYSSHFASWETIVVGNMLANSAYLPDATHANRRFKRTSVYFDTAFLINALGYAGDVRKAPCSELLNLLYEVGAELKCFRHTIDEVRGILTACAARIRRGQLKDAHGASIDYFLLNGYTASDIELLSVQLERDLAAVRISVIDKPDYKEHAYVIDERALKNRLLETITYRNPDGYAVDRDVASIAAIARLRQGRQTELIEECMAVFVSSNFTLARIAREFSAGGRYSVGVALCITDYTLTNLLWLKKPHQVPNLPRKRIIADYYASMQPDENIVRQYYSETEKLLANKSITKDDYYLLRYSLEAKHGLMYLTHGGEEVVTELTIKEALEYVHEHLRAEDQAKIQEETRRREEADKNAEHLRTAEIERTSRISMRAHKIAQAITRAIRLSVVIILIYATIVTFPWNLPVLTSAVPNYLVTLCLVLLLVFSLVDLISGTPVKDHMRRLENYLSVKIERLIMALSS